MKRPVLLATLILLSSSSLVAQQDAHDKVFNQLKAAIHAGQSQQRVKSILLANGFKPWSCQGYSTGSDAYYAVCHTTDSKEDSVQVFFTVKERHGLRNPDTGEITTVERRVDRIAQASFTFPNGEGGVALCCGRAD
ncbi:MAG: hypothetical protein WA604_23715 [Candidatus Sulfotelmatobacter sp.]|jgi:hypothetical protein